MGKEGARIGENKRRRISSASPDDAQHAEPPAGELAVARAPGPAAVEPLEAARDRVLGREPLFDGEERACRSCFQGSCDGTRTRRDARGCE